MLMGEFERSIDAKGRLIIPAKFRDQLGASFVLTRGMDGCLFGYPIQHPKTVVQTCWFAKRLRTSRREYAYRSLGCRTVGTVC